MKHFFTLLLLMAVVSSASAQSEKPGKISGTLTDSLTTEPVAYANAVLKDGDKLVAGTAADGSGAFLLSNLPLGNYTLELTFIGYKARKIPVSLTTAKPELALGTLHLSTDSKMLAAVEVTAMKALVEDKGDKLVYNAENDASNAGGTAADVLRKVPTLTVDLDGNVQMRGNGNIKVLVNGKPSGMMARNLADALRQMPADVIKSVEVITSPGARYDAEGSAGVINIITKKGLKGFNGSVNATAGNLNRALGTKLSYRKDKLGISLAANGYQYRNKWRNEISRIALEDGQITSILTQQGAGNNLSTGGYGELSIDYDPDSTSRINLSGNVWGGDYPNDVTTHIQLRDASGAPLTTYRTERRYKNPYGNGQLDLGYTKTFKPDQEFALLTQYSRMPDNYFYDLDTYTEGNELTMRQHSTNYSRNQEYTLQTDYTHPFKLYGARDTTSLKIEVGAKAIRRDIGSEFRVKQAEGSTDPLAPDPDQSDDFDYFQRVYSGYTSLHLSTKNKWNITAGLRLEHTDIEGEFLSTATPLKNDYTNLIPSLTIAKGIGSQTIKMSYTQRIQRPMIWYLNPWVDASDTMNLRTGNPYLKPELSHGLELAHSINTEKGISLNSALFWRYTDNAIEYISFLEDDGVSLTLPKNIASRMTYGLNMNVSGQLTKIWQLNGGAEARMVNMESKALGLERNALNWYFYVNSTVKLPKDFSVQVNGNYNNGWIGLQQRNSAWYWHGISAKKEFMDKKASLTLGINNPFTSRFKQVATRADNNFTADIVDYRYNRSARLTFEWRFGQMIADNGKRTKKISNDNKAGR
ncbi:TonB-dependent receptor domain-containing protein [Pontibacter burrus]|uniref:TonB-dependent receptor n=1 Tax=Pontibacter burrus TaxID=2704466 RepID=A0A6B3LW17_9BACT|nr:TonB-dependent receptor [Pontibacter burrus]NEM97631.1 TonB-dependent receptor [Pontibacter burrus]